MKKYLLLILFAVGALALAEDDLLTVARQNITGTDVVATLSSAEGDGGIGQWLNDHTGGKW